MFKKGTRTEIRGGTLNAFALEGVVSEEREEKTLHKTVRCGSDPSTGRRAGKLPGVGETIPGDARCNGGSDELAADGGGGGAAVQNAGRDVAGTGAE